MAFKTLAGGWARTIVALIALAGVLVQPAHGEEERQRQGGDSEVADRAREEYARLP